MDSGLKRSEVAVYDHTITKQDDWNTLRPEVIVDPMIYRIGEIFLAGRRDGGDQLWDAVSKDIGALVSFFDLLVLHERLPAFNYADTWDQHCNLGGDLFTVVNGRTKVIHQIDVEYPVYMTSKMAALDTLQLRAGEGVAALLPPVLQGDLVEELSALEYRWSPHLGPLEHAYEGGAKTAAAFLLGTLVFSAYAQQCGAPHVMSPKRSRLFTASALAAPRGGFEIEDDLYGELSRRFSDAGDGWRDRELAWTPSFLPWLLRGVDPYRTRPVDMLDKVLELREIRAVKEFRRVRAAALAGDDAAIAELGKLARAMTEALRTDHAELSRTRTILVEVMPKVFGATAGAALGAGAAGPLGAALGATLGIASEEALKRVNGTVWGFVFERLPFVSARKLLTRAVHAERDTMATLANHLRTIWQSPPPRRA